MVAEEIEMADAETREVTRTTLYLQIHPQLGGGRGVWIDVRAGEGRKKRESCHDNTYAGETHPAIHKTESPQPLLGVPVDP